MKLKEFYFERLRSVFDGDNIRSKMSSGQHHEFMYLLTVLDFSVFVGVRRLTVRDFVSYCYSA